MSDTLPNGHAHSRYLAFVITTGLSSIFNILVIVVVCFAVIPAINKSAASAERSAIASEQTEKQAEKSRAIMESNSRQLEEQGKTIRRLNALLDIAEARIKEMEGKKKAAPGKE